MAGEADDFAFDETAAADLAAFGITLPEAEQPKEPTFRILAELESTVRAWLALQTQWRVGMAGATGLDYNVIEPTLRLLGLPTTDWPEIFEGLQLMERETLRVWAKQRD